MYKHFILVLFLSAGKIYSQIRFDKGYLIDNENRRVECFIKNYDWDENPKEFKYKVGEQDSVQRGGLENVKEFGIDGASRFLRTEVKMDISSSSQTDLSLTKNPIWQNEQLFLKVLVKGKASLYYYSGDHDLKRFFYSVSQSPIQQLIYKEYLVNESEKGTNNTFRQQLWSDLRCNEKGKTDAARINYRKSELVKYFVEFNRCAGDSFVLYEKRKNKDLFNLSFTPGINFSSLSIANSEYSQDDTDFGKQRSFRMGLEAELILPFNKGKWSAFIEPVYQKLEAEGQSSQATSKLHYQSVEFSLGVRHYFYLGDKTKVFVNAMLNPGIGMYFDSNIELAYTTISVKSNINMALGGGIAHGRLTGELRYYTNKNILSSYVGWFSEYHVFSFIVGYKIIKPKKK